MQDGFIKVGAGTPKISVGHCRENAEACFTLMREAADQGVRVLTLPQLCLTGATCGDLFFQNTLLAGAQEALATVLEATSHLDMITTLGLPISYNNNLYNCAAVIHKGIILALVPKSHIPTNGDGSQCRWFTSGAELSATVTCCTQEVPFGTGLLFPCTTLPGLSLGVELGEDLWAPTPPSVALAAGGATLILNPSATCETVGRAAQRRATIANHSARLACGYLYADAGEGESTTDLVFAGHTLILENGKLLAQRRFATGLTVSEVDVGRLCHQRRQLGLFPHSTALTAIPFALEPAYTALTRHISPTPFVPGDLEERGARCDEILKIAALGLKKRLEHTGAKAAIIGLSGGLDSTLAVLITMVAMKLLGRPASDVIAVTMPAFGTTSRTRDNAVELASRLGATLRSIDISKSVKSHFVDIGQSLDCHDVTYENAQARERTQVLMDIANQEDGLVIGTGDLSELALGWCTYNGDQMSMYGVNAAIPKTMVRHLVNFVCQDKAPAEPELAAVLADILDTPVSPELLPAIEGEIAQRTEDLVGPYVLHDFFLYYVIRWGFSPCKVLRLAEGAFARKYDRTHILHWLKVFYRRLFSQQFKRSAMPDGPKVGTVGLSPRGGWQMPSDAVSRLWLDALEGL